MKAFFLFVFVVVFLGCSKNKVSPQEYLNYYNSHNDKFCQSRDYRGLQFSLSYLPAEFLIATEVVRDGNNSRNIDSTLSDYKGHVYFSLELRRLDSDADLLAYALTSHKEYIERVQYFSYEFSQDIKMYVGGKPVSCALYHFENSYGGTPKLKFVFSFPKAILSSDSEIIINDKTFNTGIIHFPISKFDLASVPELKS